MHLLLSGGQGRGPGWRARSPRSRGPPAGVPVWSAMGSLSARRSHAYAPGRAIGPYPVGSHGGNFRLRAMTQRLERGVEVCYDCSTVSLPTSVDAQKPRCDANRSGLRTLWGGSVAFTELDEPSASGSNEPVSTTQSSPISAANSNLVWRGIGGWQLRPGHRHCARQYGGITISCEGYHRQKQSARRLGRSLNF
jgi:hypothetical protein